MVPQLIFSGHCWAKASLDRLVQRISKLLVSQGVHPGDVVAIIAKNCPTYVALSLACRQSGVYLTSINWHFKDQEVAYILADCGADLFFCQDQLISGLSNTASNGKFKTIIFPEEFTPADADNSGWLSPGDDYEPAAKNDSLPNNSIVYTSGTTGTPKGVRRFAISEDLQESAITALNSINKAVYGLDKDSVVLLSAPMYHSAVLTYSMLCMAQGCLLVLEPAFEAERTLALIDEYKITHAYLVPTMFQRLLALPEQTRTKYQVNSLKHVGSTGSVCAPDLKHGMIQWWGPVINEAYGSTETSYATSITSQEWLRKPGSAGRPIGQAQVKIIGDSDEELATGEVGVIYVLQPAVPDFTYINREDDRKKIQRGDLITLGDMGYLDNDGYLFICDRKSEMIISGGVNIYPAEVESAILPMPEIADAAVFSIPDPIYGESVACAVKLRPGHALTAEELKSRLQAVIANYKVPRMIKFVDELPREETGKIFKRKLREPYWAGMTRRI